MPKNYIKTKEGITTDGSKGGIFIGDRHSAPSGGIPVTVDGKTNILVEDAEPIVVPEAVNNPKKHLFNGEQLTAKQILDKINRKYGGVSIKKEGGVLDKGGKLTKSGYNSIDEILELAEPLIEKIVKERIEAKKKKGERISENEEQFIRLDLTYDLTKALGNYLEREDEIIEPYFKTEKGVVVLYANIKRGDKKYYLTTQMIIAGGHNIQVRHYRYLVDTNLPYNKTNLAVKNIEEKIKTKKKNEKVLEEILYNEKVIERYDKEIAANKKEVERRKLISDADAFKLARKENSQFTHVFDSSYEDNKKEGMPVAKRLSESEYREYVDNFKKELIEEQKGTDKLSRDISIKIKYISDIKKKIEKLKGKMTEFEHGGTLLNEPIPVKSGSVIITRDASLDNITKHNFDGKKMTNTEVLSKINKEGGGVEFKEGGTIHDSQIKKSLSLLKETNVPFLFQSAKENTPDELIKYIAEQGQGLHSNDKQDLYNATCKIFGKGLTDASVEAYPIKYKDGGLLHAIDLSFDNLQKNGLVLKSYDEKSLIVIVYNSGGQEIGKGLYKGLYNINLIMDYICHSGDYEVDGKKYRPAAYADLANQIITVLDNPMPRHKSNFDINKMDEYRKANHLIIMNQNEVVYDSNKPDERYKEGGELSINEIETMEIQPNEIADSKLGELEKVIETKENETTLHEIIDENIEGEAIVEMIEEHLKENPNYYNELEVEIKPVSSTKKENKHYFTAAELGVSESTPAITIGTIFYSDSGLEKWEVEYITDDSAGLKHLIKSPLDTQKESKELTFEQIKQLFDERLIQIHNITNDRELALALSLLKAHIKGESHHHKISKFKEGGEVDAKEAAKKFMESLSEEERENLLKDFGAALENLKNTYKQEVEKLETEKSNIKDRINEINKEEKGLAWDFKTEEGKLAIPKYKQLGEEKQELYADIKNLEVKIIHAKNVEKAVLKGGTISEFTDQKGTINDNIPSLLNVDTSVISFDEETILTDEMPAYIPYINEDVFRQKGYLFDAIRIAKDTYIVAVNGYQEKIGAKKEFIGRSVNLIGGRDAYTYEHGYVLVTLDQLVLLQDYYFTKAKAIKVKEADERNERSLAYYNQTPESARERILNQKGYYNYLPKEVQKKVTREQFEALDLAGKEALYKPYKRYNPERLKSQLDSHSMWTSFHFMYERFLDPTKVRTVNERGQFANSVVWEYWVKFREMMDFKIKDIKIQREVDNEQYKKALETSFGDINTNDILFAKYGILVKRQDGKMIDAIQVNQIENGWIALQKVYGNLSNIARADGMKISHTSNTNVFASKAVGVFVPKMKTIAVSAKHGNEMFESIFSHETAHYIDNHLGRLSGKRWATDDYEGKAGVLAFTFRKLMNVKSSSDYYNSTKECFARCMEQYFSVTTFSDDAKNVNKPYFLDDNYVSKKNFEETIKPLVEEFLSQTGFGAYVEEKKIEVVEPEQVKEENINEQSDAKLDLAENKIEVVEDINSDIPDYVKEKFKDKPTDTNFTFLKLKGNMLWRRDNSNGKIIEYGSAPKFQLPNDNKEEPHSYINKEMLENTFKTYNSASEAEKAKLLKQLKESMAMYPEQIKRYEAIENKNWAEEGSYVRLKTSYETGKEFLKEIEKEKPKFETPKEDYTVSINYWINHYDKELKSGKITKDNLLKKINSELSELNKVPKDERLDKYFKAKAISNALLKHYEVKKPVIKKATTKRVAKVKEVDNFNKGRSEKSLKSDSKRTALPAGKRVSSSGNTYYENRPNRADANPKTRLKKGGQI